MLVIISVTTKIAAVFVIPPVQGLIEILAVIILHSKGMLSEFAYASLMVLAVVSTILTSPRFKLISGNARATRNP